MATHSSILVWEIPQMEESGGLQSMGFSRQEYWSGVPLPSPVLCLVCSKSGVRTHAGWEWASLVAQPVKAPVCNAGDQGSIPG